MINWKNKKSQYYVFIAVLLCAISLSILYTISYYPKQKSKFTELNENYLNEVSYVISSSLSGDVNQTVIDFTDRFLDYSITVHPKYNILYLLTYDDKIVINNNLDENINVKSDYYDFDINPREIYTIDEQTWIDITLEGKVYRFNINKTTQFNMISKIAYANEVEIFVY